MAHNKTATAQEYLDRNAREIERSLMLFQESAHLFSSPTLINEYENKWVAAHDGEIVAVADTMDALMVVMSQKEVPANESMIRHLDREKKTFIL